MTASLWLATFGIIPLAVAAAGVLIPSTSRWTMVHLPYIDCVSFAQYLPFQVRHAGHERSTHQHGTSAAALPVAPTSVIRRVCRSRSSFKWPIRGSQGKQPTGDASCLQRPWSAWPGPSW